jgi:hypothetical protein
MSEASQPVTPRAEIDKTVLLLTPQALVDPIDPAHLCRTLTPTEAVRVLLCLPDLTNDEKLIAAERARADALVTALAAALVHLDIEVQILLGPAVEAPKLSGRVVVRAPPSTSAADQTEVALALSDVILVAPSLINAPPKTNQIIDTAVRLDKPMIVPRADIPPALRYPNATSYIDPSSWWHIGGRHCFGRFEQFLLELFAFKWFKPEPPETGQPQTGTGKKASEETGVTKSLKQLRKCMGKWRPTPYWPTSAPDSMAVEDSSRITAGFEAMDRSALYGSYVHRDLAWFAQFGAAFAVAFAVAGHLDHSREMMEWGIAEVIVLFAVVIAVLGARSTGLQDRWTACRLGAEQLRIARMSLPLLVLPQALATKDTQSTSDTHGKKKDELEFRALAQVKRIVREQGLPRQRNDFDAMKAAKWLHLIVADQIAYHRNNHRKLDKAEDGLRITTQGLFIIVMAAVVFHLYFPHSAPWWLLLVTAAGPAFAAALHGAGTRLGIVHRAALSLEVDAKLGQVDEALKALIRKPPSLQREFWSEVRKLAYTATEIMGSENTSWHGLVRRYRDELP